MSKSEKNCIMTLILAKIVFFIEHKSLLIFLDWDDECDVCAAIDINNTLHLFTMKTFMTLIYYKQN